MTGNPPPRRALPRTSPLLPGDAHVAVPEPLADPARDAGAVEPGTPASATGRDLLIRAPHEAPAAGPTKKGRASTVPSLRELMPDSAPRVVAPDPPAHEPPAHEPSTQKGGKAKKRQALPPAPGAPAGRHDKHVEVVLTMPRGLRKRLRARAEDMGMTVEQMITQLAEVWIDG
jgi:hypothetical protein